MNKDHAGGDNPKVSIKVEYVDNEYDGNVSDDDTNNIMVVDGRYPIKKRNRKNTK